MALRKIFKQFAPNCARCSNSQQKHLLCRTLWVAAARKDATKDARGPCLKTRFNSTDTKEAVVRSSRPHVDLPKISLSDYMFSRFSKFGSKTALHDFETGTTYRYDELEDLVRRVGSFLVRRGFKKGDVIAYWGTNNPEFALLMLGCASVGVILTTANPMYTEGEISRHMEHSGAKAIFTIPSLVHKVQEAGIWDMTVIGWSEGVRPFSALLKDDGKGFPKSVECNPMDDVVILPYSSGTTGLPKGVMLTHYNVVTNLIQLRKALITTPEDSSLGVLPFFHLYGMSPLLMGALQDGAFITTLSKFDPENFLTAIQQQKITRLMAVPPIALFMCRHPMVSHFDLSSITEAMCAAAPIGESLTEEFMDKFKIPIFQGYGLTETGPVTHIDSKDINFGTIGRLISDTEGKIVDPETRKTLARGETGEVCVRGPQMMKGYLNNEKATRDMIDDDGWLYTGDVGHIKENDCFVISDRLKELIKYKGLQVAPAELEDLLQKHPAVLDAAVIGMPDDRAGELPRAYVVSQPDAYVTPPDILKYVEENGEDPDEMQHYAGFHLGHVADYKRLRGGVEFVKEIPRSPSGKILRRILRDELARNTE